MGVATPGARSLATGLIKNSNSTCLNGQPLKEDLEARLGPGGANGQRRQLLRAVGGRRRRRARCRTWSSGSYSALALAAASSWASVPSRARTRSRASGATTRCRRAAPMTSPLPACYCGRRGCIEAYLSGPGLAADHERATGERIDAARIARRAEAGDAACSATISTLRSAARERARRHRERARPGRDRAGRGAFAHRPALRAMCPSFGASTSFPTRCARASSRRCMAMRVACAARHGSGTNESVSPAHLVRLTRDISKTESPSMRYILASLAVVLAAHGRCRAAARHRPERPSRPSPAAASGACSRPSTTLPGVAATISGYTGGTHRESRPTRRSRRERTGHAEVGGGDLRPEGRELREAARRVLAQHRSDGEGPPVLRLAARSTAPRSSTTTRRSARPPKPRRRRSRSRSPSRSRS